MPSSPASTEAPKPSMYRANVPVARQLVTSMPKIPNVEEKLVSFIFDEIIDRGPSIKFNDIGKCVYVQLTNWQLSNFFNLVGQNKAKQALNELVILPAFNPGVSIFKLSVILIHLLTLN